MAENSAQSTFSLNAAIYGYLRQLIHIYSFLINVLVIAWPSSQTSTRRPIAYTLYNTITITGANVCLVCDLTAWKPYLVKIRCHFDNLTSTHIAVVDLQLSDFVNHNAKFAI